MPRANEAQEKLTIVNKDVVELAKKLLEGFSMIIDEPETPVEIVISTETRVYKVRYSTFELVKDAA